MAPEGLTTPRDAKEHKHDTLPWIIVAEHGSKAASSLDFPWQATHWSPPDGSKGTSATGHRCQAQPTKSSSDFQSRTHASHRGRGDNPDATPSGRERHRWWRTGFSPLDVNARGEDTTPSTGKAAPTGVSVAKASAQGTL